MLAPGQSWTGSTLAGWEDQSAPGRVVKTTFDDRECFSLVCEGTDVAPVTPTTNPRAQLVSPALIALEGDYTVTVDLYVPSGSLPESIASGGWVEFLQFAYGPPWDGSPPLRWMTQDGQTWGLRHADDQPYLYRTALTRDAWHSIEVGFSMNAEPGYGWVWLVYDGALVIGDPADACATILPCNDGGPNSLYLDAYMSPGWTEKIGPIYFTAPTVTRTGCLSSLARSASTGGSIVARQHGQRRHPP